MKKSFLALPLFVFTLVLLFSCASGGSAASRGGVGETSSGLTGIYAGVIPAADCPGISVVLILDSETGRYKISHQYIDRDVELTTETGTFTWDNAAKLVTLDTESLPPYYKAGRRGLTQLDISGNEITGRLAKNYELEKVEFQD